MIIRTILDTDLYKFTTSYAYIKLFPYAIGTFSFKDRDGTEYSDEFVERLRTEISQLSHVALSEKELEYMIKNCRFLPRVYWEWLSSFRFQPEKIEIRLDENRQLHIEVNDYLYKATLYEVPLLAIVSEIKNQSSGNVANLEDILYKLSEKTELSNKHQLLFSEFGTRRRFSFDVQNQVIGHLKQTAHYCIGTSNCHFAMKYGMKPMGTHPHEWFMFHGAQFGYKHANYMALENWVNVYANASYLPVEAPEGTIALPKAPFSKSTSTSTVGFPLESKTSLPITFSMHKRFFNFGHILLYENNSGIISMVGCFYTYH